MKKYLLILLLALFAFPSFSAAHALRDLRLVNIPVMGIHVQPDAAAPYDSQRVYGHEVTVHEAVNNEWLRVESLDGMVGYAREKDLMPDNPLWRLSSGRQRVKGLIGCVYPKPDLETQTLVRLPYNAYVNVIDQQEVASGRLWLKVQLIDGTVGWMLSGDLEPLLILSKEEIIKRSHMFLGLPYIWGGTSSYGFDCSGFSQTLATQMGFPMLRDSRPQCDDSRLVPVEYADIQPGDFVYFGKMRVNHVALCIAPNTIIHPAVIESLPRLMITPIDHPVLVFKGARRIPPIEFRGVISEIDDALFARMQFSWREGNPVPLKDLRHLSLRYWGFDNCMHDGELIVHAEVAQEVVDIFKELFDARFPIERMKLIDEYQADDDLSTADNNTSALCCRLLTNHTSKWSLHGFGLAIDINPRINPYHKGTCIAPKNGALFLDRTLPVRGLIRKGDVCYNAFAKRGWLWAGEWMEQYGYVDYQHFYKDVGVSDELVALAAANNPRLES